MPVTSEDLWLVNFDHNENIGYESGNQIINWDPD